MVDWHNPNVIADERLALTNLTHALAGLYIWELVTTLDFEWSFFTGRRPWKWSMLFYLSGRYCVLAAIISQLIIFDTRREMNCMALERSIQGFAFVGIDTASVLIALRAFAFWQQNYYTLVILVAVFMTNVGIQIHGIVVGVSSWDPATNSCTIQDTSRMRLQLIVNFATDVTLLAIMLVGLIRQRIPGSLYQLLFNQGVLWTVIATLCYVPLVVLSCLNLNDAMNLMAPILSYITLVICATRMHRGLIDNVYGPAQRRSDFMCKLRPY
ncbi:hypothetical protein OBBRIDRAFT_794180 [Obba rivulosa]|uniref:Transmembrane protein n=1 Tax=Obba rivulosa TaxID=1052685 RepID=A0A8E2AZL5_9APHY|nr:hypothetical protein OBBRIDRAFT_794180 [Obba rivulosa]